MLFAEQYLDEFYPSMLLVPGLYNGSRFDYPIFMIYKKGVKIVGLSGVRSHEALEEIIIKNYEYLIIYIRLCFNCIIKFK
jgi:hypothetical protein